MYAIFKTKFSLRGRGRNGTWLPCPVVVGLDRFCAFEIVISCLLGGKAGTRQAEEVGEEEEVTVAVTVLNSAYLFSCWGGLCSGSLVAPFVHVGSTVLHFTTVLPILTLTVHQSSTNKQVFTHNLQNLDQVAFIVYPVCAPGKLFWEWSKQNGTIKIKLPIGVQCLVDANINGIW